ncbi:putative polyketide synthase [Mycena vitilis]|nr:putative polyketide synthase [Mycena vitilis]
MAQPIAIVGISAELPSGPYSMKNLDHTAFFQFLLDKGQAYEKAPSERFDIDACHGDSLGQVHVQNGSFLKDIDLFDNVEFGISSRDARAMAPATKKLLENCFLALLDSGIDYRRRNVGCYTSGTSIELSNVSSPDRYEPRGSFAGYPTMIANRVSNHLDLLGPSIPVDTACSSSLTALHLAVQAIILGDCEAAVVGGCQLNHRLMDWITYSQSSVLSADGKCKPFDESADGFARAEGCVAIVIKPLKDALRDRDRVYATILGTAINSTGAGGPPGAPVADSQRAAMTEAFKRASRLPTDVAYVELHATGTAKGDPTEANWVGEHFQRADELLVGSVKGNIGHTEITAFLASLSKVISIFNHKTIPPNVNLETLNPAIKWREYNFRVPTTATPLPCGELGRAVISMASSGIGGSNGHVVLEEAPTRMRTVEVEADGDRPVLLMAAGLSPRSATVIADQLSHSFDIDDENAALSTVLGRRSKQMNWRSYAVTKLGPRVSLEFSSPQYSGRDANSVAFVFSGQGPQHESMGRELFTVFPAFRDSILDMDAVYKQVTGKSTIDDFGLFGSTRSSCQFSDTWPISLALPAIAMFQMALFDLLTHLGVQPDVVLGHSAGETSLLYTSGAASKQMALELSIIRGQVFSSLEDGDGTMAALSCGPEDARRLLATHMAANAPSVVELACFNSPSAVAIAGQNIAIANVLDLARGAGILGRQIRTRVPVHSSMMEACQDRYRAAVGDLFLRYPGSHVPKIPTYSTLTGQIFCGPFDAEYFWKNTRSEVRFEQTIRSLGGSFTFVEISPHPVLSGYISEMVSSPVLSCVQRPKKAMPSTEHHDMLAFLGRLTSAGHNCVEFTLLNGKDCSQSRITLPEYPFAKKTFPLYVEGEKRPAPHRGPVNHPHLKVNQDTHPTLAEHVIRGEPIWPASAFLEMAMEFGASTLLNVNLRSVLSMSAEFPVKVDLDLDGAYWKVTSSIPGARYSDDSGDNEIKRIHADGYLSREPPPVCEDLDIPEIRSRCDSHVDSEFYASLAYFSSYGPTFQRITNLYYGRDEALASINGLDPGLATESPYILHPAVLDACIQVSAYRPFNGDVDPTAYYLPSRIGELVLHQPSKPGYFPAHVYAHVKLSGWMPHGMRYDVTVTDDSGKRLCTLLHVEVAKHHISPPREFTHPLDLVLQNAFPASSGISLKHNGATDIPASTSSEVLIQDAGPGAAVAESKVALRSAILSLSADHRRQSIRIAFLGDMDNPIPDVNEVLREFPRVAFELLIPENADATATIEHPFSVIRHLKDECCDIVVAFRMTESSPGLHSIFRACNEVLLPGGTLVLTELSDNDEGYSCPYGTESDHAAVPVLEDMRYSMRKHTAHSGHRTIEFSKAVDDPVRSCSVFNPLDAVVIRYKLGGEGKLQSDVKGLDAARELDVWILAADGPDTAAGLGLVRALRREYLFWTIRFVSFPTSLGQDMQRRRLEELPLSLKSELEIIFSPLGELLVPRLVPLAADAHPNGHSDRPSTLLDPNLPPDHTIVEIHHTVTFGSISAFAASVVPPSSGSPRCDTLIVGLSTHASKGLVSIDLGATIPIQAGIPFSVVDHAPGIAAAILGPGLAVWNRLHRLDSLRILITHCDVSIGASVCGIYLHKGLSYSKLGQDATVHDIAAMGYQCFDLILSGYTDKAHAQILRTLLRPSTGKLFLWHEELPRMLERDPCAIGDALHAAQSSFESFSASPTVSVESETHINPALNPGAVFDGEKTYLIIGGIGSIGAHVALFMSTRGARHIVVTSRSGADGLKNLIAERIFTYLKGLDYLDLRLEAVDATSSRSMRKLLGSISTNLGGCVILTAVLADGLFPTLGDKEFTTVFEAKSGVLQTLRESINDVTSLDFIVAFSSITSVVGTGGQTNYCAANALLEGEVSSLSNAFSFVCPGILDTSLMLAGANVGNGDRLKHLIEWSISTDELIGWLDDAICKFQHGARFHRYIPNLDWEAMDRTLGMPKLGAHLVPSRTATIVNGTAETVLDKASHIIRSVLSIPENDFDADVPLTSYGIDSLSASRLSFALRSTLKATQIQLLADASLNDLIRKNPQSSSESVPTLAPAALSEEHGVLALMRGLVVQYSDIFARYESPITIDPPPSTGRTFLLTGTTGALGCHILARLLEDNDVVVVYALNRKDRTGISLLERQTKAFTNQGLSSAFGHSPKLILVEGELGDENFGLSATLKNKMMSSITHIIHNAWRVDFYTPLAEFEGLIRGTSKLLELAMRCSIRPSVSFISTVAVCHLSPDGSSMAPETPITDPCLNIRSGYLESKWVAERLVQMAADKGVLRTNVIRVGLLTGGDSGFWDTAHWMPRLAESAVHIGCLPDGDDLVSWIPVKEAAAAISDMQDAMNDTIHLIHPRPTIWTSVMRPLASLIGVPLVPYAEWFARLQSTAQFVPQSGKKKDTGAAALKLLDFFHGGVERAPNMESMGLIPRVAGDKGTRNSTTLKESSSSLGRADVEKWVRYWRQVGFLPARDSAQT